MDRLKLALVTFLKRDRTYITKITVSAFSVIEALNVIKDICLCVISCQLSCAVNPLTFEQPKETFNDGIVIAIAACTHAALNAVLLEFFAEVIARILTAAVGMMD